MFLFWWSSFFNIQRLLLEGYSSLLNKLFTFKLGFEIGNSDYGATINFCEHEIHPFMEYIFSNVSQNVKLYFLNISWYKL